ncbi:phosphonate ABC transporter ATP-binding protein [Mesorhizobium sp.]|uniref:phosphonate ABC transporter ATP-binding protein n=1 Tax=Mesorhizobium sp. TaxID=1871066 RepID=UPI000FE2C216|nr:phosphonate ABC transporter ATP-binding protein [Mesorhizobium sp.]RWH67988.1 MAG: phosphonate ABC transporter ATP-binding protein [Mesorhizobium sp.]RWL21090.1 MAG: phosphonate ABC transporter ATP-binding protein [Mesorhizobium sp.]RWL24964.1 MAG: phosphonate ABC transporter ATP-binding protein [Mesorhizobium sp.]RWL29342.1 MAG: phosphonate ABC transporter ATP-binding protein [Mesorhizobium sp.]RWL47046.1 MAG: phosphonate ABC transporter ATP-binding protein [Mesorhizobium sp.]
MSASSATLEIRGVTRRFGKNTAVSDINISIPRGQMVGIIGRSGAGKSTLLRMINRLIDPSQGSIFFDGAEVSSLQGSPLRRWQRDCAMIFQQFNLVPRLDVLTNVLLGRLNHRSTVSNLLGMFTRIECAEAVAALERLDIARTALQPAGTLSGGQQQRVAIARAMMQQPKVLLADEPIASLDPLNAKVVMDSLRDINLREGITVVTNLHTLDTARAYCSRIIGMAAGKVVFDGAPEDLDRDAVRMVYGADASGAEISETITSTSVTIKPKIIASAGPLEPAFPGY